MNLSMRAVLPGLCLLSSACVINSEYPDDWPKDRSSAVGDCPEISGTYEDIGPGSIDGESKSLAKTFIESENVTADYVRIEQANSDSLLVTVILDGSVSATLDLNREQDDFWCEDGKLWLSDVDQKIHVLGIARGRDNTGFSKAEDGSLIAEFDSSGGGLVFFIPAYGKVSSYFRWYAVD